MLTSVNPGILNSSEQLNLFVLVQSIITPPEHSASPFCCGVFGAGCSESILFLLKPTSYPVREQFIVGADSLHSKPSRFQRYST